MSPRWSNGRRSRCCRLRRLAAIHLSPQTHFVCWPPILAFLLQLHSTLTYFTSFLYACQKSHLFHPSPSRNKNTPSSARVISDSNSGCLFMIPTPRVKKTNDFLKCVWNCIVREEGIQRPISTRSYYEWRTLWGWCNLFEIKSSFMNFLYIFLSFVHIAYIFYNSFVAETIMPSRQRFSFFGNDYWSQSSFLSLLIYFTKPVIQRFIHLSIWICFGKESAVEG